MMRKRMRRTVVAAMLIAAPGSLFLACPAHAAKIQLIPSIALEEAWDSNIFNTSANETSDYVTRAKPRLDFQFATFQTTTKIGGGVQSEWYASHSDLNSYTAVKNVDLTVLEPLQITPRFSVSPFASFVESDDAVRRNELTEAPAPDIPPTEAVVTGRVKTRDYRGFIRTRYLLTPRTDINVGVGATRRDFSGSTTGITTAGLTLERSTRAVADATLYYGMTPRLSSGLFLNAGYNSFEKTPDSKTYTGGVSARYRLTPVHTLTVRGGATYLSSSADAAGRLTEGWYPFGNLSVGYTWQNLKATLSGWYELVGAGAFGQTTKRANVSLTITQQLTEKWGWDLAGFYQNNKSFDEPVTVNVDTMQGAARIRYAAVDWASFYLNGNIARQDSKGLEGTDLIRGSVVLGVMLSTTFEPY